MTLIRKTAAAIFAFAGISAAHATSVSLGQSAQDFTLYGEGAVAPGIGSFNIQQGAPVTSGGVSTFTLSGAITGGDPGFNTGTYRFVTTYDGASTPQGGPNAPFGQSNPANVTQFYYDALDASTNVTLYLNTPGKSYAIPLVTGGNFVAGTGYSFAFTTTSCSGVAVCTQNNVGLTPGASISGPVTTNANFTIASPVGGVPEPASWALLIAGFGAVGFAARRRRFAVVSA